MESWIEQLLPIIKEYKDGSNEPLDGDDVDELCKIIKAKINLNEGNITEVEYNDILDSPRGNISNRIICGWSLIDVYDGVTQLKQDDTIDVDFECTDDFAHAVLDLIERRFDATIGVTWDTLFDAIIEIKDED